MNHKRHKQRADVCKRNGSVPKLHLNLIQRLFVQVRSGNNKTCRIGKILTRQRPAQHSELRRLTLNGMNHELLIDIHQECLHTRLSQMGHAAECIRILIKGLGIRDDVGILGIQNVRAFRCRTFTDIDIPIECWNDREGCHEQFITRLFEELLNFLCCLSGLFFYFHLAPDTVQKLRATFTFRVFD